MSVATLSNAASTGFGAPTARWRDGGVIFSLPEASARSAFERLKYESGFFKSSISLSSAKAPSGPGRALVERRTPDVTQISRPSASKYRHDGWLVGKGELAQPSIAANGTDAPQIDIEDIPRVGLGERDDVSHLVHVQGADVVDAREASSERVEGGARAGQHHAGRIAHGGVAERSEKLGKQVGGERVHAGRASFFESVDTKKK